MKVDLSEVAGFPLTLDTLTNDLSSGEAVRFDRIARRATEMAAVLLEPDGLAPTTELYWLFPLSEAGAALPLLEEAGLTFSCVLLPPLKIGREFVKTQGHYHPSMPGSELPYPEVYAHLSGDILLLLQRRAGERADRLDDCVLIELHAGGTVTIPPGYAHILINPSPQPAAIAGLYSRSFSPVYEPIVSMAGAAYYLVDEGGARAIPNPRYADRPPLRRLGDVESTRFAPPDDGRPLWTSFLADPGRYAFLFDPDAARRRFSEEGEAR